MIDFDSIGQIVVTFKDRFGYTVAEELRALGYPIEEEGRTSHRLRGSMNDCIKLNLRLRSASHVLFEIKRFYLHHADDIYRRVKSIPWENYIDAFTYFSVQSHVDNPSVDNPLFVNVRIKDAIVDRFRDQTGRRPDSGSSFDGAVFQMYWKDKQAILYINTSGETLAKHGYRKIPGKAPMLEALASACIQASGWNGRTPFLNPMCGSGTLAIEAALLASNRFPGLYRENYSFMHILGYDAEVYRRIFESLEKQIVDNPGVAIYASDNDPQAIAFAKENAETAGVAHLITFEEVDFREATVPETGYGVLMVNPEYGERLGEEEELEATYAALGDFMKQRCTGYTGAIFTGNLALGKKIGLRTSKKIPFYNGTIDSRLLLFKLFRGKAE